MQESSTCSVESERVSAIRRGLIVTPIDWPSRKATKEQCSGAPMTDNRYVAIAEGLRHDPLDGANNPRLSICRRLPASDAGFRLSKERIDHRFELSLREITRRRSVILAQVTDDGVPTEPEPVGEDLRPLSCLAFATGKDAAHLFDPRGATIACIRARPRSLSGQSGIGTLGLITTSGWVMKKTDGMGLRGRTEQLDCNFSSAPGGDKDG